MPGLLAAAGGAEDDRGVAGFFGCGTEVLFREDSTASCHDTGISYRKTNLGFAMVRWQDSRRVPSASTPLAGAGGTGRGLKS
jgi:hypothetical protein